MFDLSKPTPFIAFDTALRIVKINSDGSIPDAKKAMLIGNILWPEDFATNGEAAARRVTVEIPKTLELIYDVLNDGKEPTKKPAETNYLVDSRLYSFEDDASAIFASFRIYAGINLHNVVGKMSWEEFVSILFNLPEESAFMQHIKIRSMKVADYPEKQRPSIMRLKDSIKLTPLKLSPEQQKERDKQMLAAARAQFDAL